MSLRSIISRYHILILGLFVCFLNCLGVSSAALAEEVYRINIFYLARPFLPTETIFLEFVLYNNQLIIGDISLWRVSGGRGTYNGIKVPLSGGSGCRNLTKENSIGHYQEHYHVCFYVSKLSNSSWSIRRTQETRAEIGSTHTEETIKFTASGSTCEVQLLSANIVNGHGVVGTLSETTSSQCVAN